MQLINFKINIKDILLFCVITLSLAGCSTTNLTAPCPNYGAHCDKVPINSWNNT